MALNITDIYWLAGFMDGEACFSMWGKTPSITIAQKEMWPLEKVHKLVGGKFYKFKNWGTNKETFYNSLHIHGKRAIGLMMTLYSLLSPRRQEKIEEIIAKWKLIPCRGEHNRIKTHCKRGHEFTEQNTYMKADGSGRECRKCQKIHNEKYLSKKQVLQIA
ncbi:MAG TPA: hypothetical protein VIH42_12220 [Thermoguttaceae bacterium]